MATDTKTKSAGPKPESGRGARKAAEPLKELGTDPVSGGTITLREGRFGPYVTDGETNASLRKEDDPNTITPERAQELLQLRRERGPVKKKKKVTKKAAAKKTTTKAASTGKKTTKKAASSKKKASKAPSSKKASAKKSSKKTVARVSAEG